MMKKTIGSNFKINRSVKRQMATILDDTERHIFKNLMIQAQMQGEIVIAVEKKKKKVNGHEISVS